MGKALLANKPKNSMGFISSQVKVLNINPTNKKTWKKIEDNYPGYGKKKIYIYSEKDTLNT